MVSVLLGIGLGVTMALYPGYLAPLTTTVTGDLSALLRSMFVSSAILLVLNPTCVLWFILS